MSDGCHRPPGSDGAIDGTRTLDGAEAVSGRHRRSPRGPSRRRDLVPDDRRSPPYARSTAASKTRLAARQMSGPVPSPSMKGMIGRSGTFRSLVAVTVIFSPSAGTSMPLYAAISLSSIGRGAPRRRRVEKGAGVYQRHRRVSTSEGLHWIRRTGRGASPNPVILHSLPIRKGPPEGRPAVSLRGPSSVGRPVPRCRSRRREDCR